jgi:hypothetical protein
MIPHLVMLLVVLSYFGLAARHKEYGTLVAWWYIVLIMLCIREWGLLSYSVFFSCLLSVLGVTIIT